MGRDFVLQLRDRLSAICSAVHPEWRDDGPHRAAVGRIIDALHQSICLESIDQLGDVGANAPQAARELAQCEWLTCSGQRIDRLVLGRRQPDFRQDHLETLLDTPRSFEEHDHVTSMVLIFDLRVRSDAELG